MSGMWDDTLNDDPRLVELCLNCDKKRCAGLCDEYAALRHEISPFSAKAKYRGKLWEMDGRAQTLTQWAHEYGLCDRTLRKRIDRGMSLRDALNSFYKRVRK